jgi:DNA-directed RNA polymerase beta subunit
MFKKTIDVALFGEEEDRDHFKFKRFQTSGELCFIEFRKFFNLMIETMLKELDRRLEFEKQTYKGKNIVKLLSEENISYYWKSYSLLDNFKKSFKGLWDKKSGVSQVLSRISYMGSISHLRRISLIIDKQSKQLGIRKLHSSSWGFTCPIDNPDGKSIGIIKSLSLFSNISTQTKISFIKSILEKQKNFKYITLINHSHFNPEWTKVFINSDLVGVITSETNIFHYTLKQLRRSNEFSKTVSLSWNIIKNTYEIFCDSGRLYRYIYQENLKSDKDEAHGGAHRRTDAGHAGGGDRTRARRKVGRDHHLDDRDRRRCERPASPHDRAGGRRAVSCDQELRHRSEAATDLHPGGCDGGKGTHRGGTLRSRRVPARRRAACRDRSIAARTGIRHCCST